jgi:addiction module HigA family antidote
MHPGRILLEDYLAPHGISVFSFARDIGVSPWRIYEIVQGERAITPILALRLAHYFGLSKRFWLDLQAQYDRQIEQETTSGKVIDIAAIRKHRIWPPPARSTNSSDITIER